MEITVIVCTYNRSDTLAGVLDGLASSKMPESIEWEIVVVDNNSHDDTRGVVQTFCDRYPTRFRYLFEQQQGKSYALNSGIREARGNLIAFTDDDVTINSSWLQEITSALREGQWAGAGGPVVLSWPRTPPTWIPIKDRYGLAPVAMFDPKLEAGPLHEPPFGANVAFRKDVFAKYGGFRPDLGRCGDGMLSNEDTEFGERLLSAGEKLCFVPTAVIGHPVSENRLKKNYFLTWWFDKARADVRQYGIPEKSRWSIAGIPMVLFRRGIRWVTQWMLTVSPSKRFSCKVKVWSLAGTVYECYCLSNSRR